MIFKINYQQQIFYLVILVLFFIQPCLTQNCKYNKTITTISPQQQLNDCLKNSEYRSSIDIQFTDTHQNYDLSLLIEKIKNNPRQITQIQLSFANNKIIDPSELFEAISTKSSSIVLLILDFMNQNADLNLKNLDKVLTNCKKMTYLILQFSNNLITDISFFQNSFKGSEVLNQIHLHFENNHIKDIKPLNSGLQNIKGPMKSVDVFLGSKISQEFSISDIKNIFSKFTTVKRIELNLELENLQFNDINHLFVNNKNLDILKLSFTINSDKQVSFKSFNNLFKYNTLLRNLEINLNIPFLSIQDIKEFRNILPKNVSYKALKIYTITFQNQNIGDIYPFILNSDLPVLQYQTLIFQGCKSLQQINSLDLLFKDFPFLDKLSLDLSQCKIQDINILNKIIKDNSETLQYLSSLDLSFAFNNITKIDQLNNLFETNYEIQNIKYDFSGNFINSIENLDLKIGIARHQSQHLLDNFHLNLNSNPIQNIEPLNNIFSTITSKDFYISSNSQYGRCEISQPKSKVASQNENYMFIGSACILQQNCLQVQQGQSQQCMSCLEQQGQCQQCQDNKLPPKCDKCQMGYFIVNQQQNNPLIFDCQKCPPGCIDCENEKECKTCDLDFQKNKHGLCSCIDGYSFINNNCIKCPEFCLKCHSQNKCTDCFEGYIFSNENNKCEYKKKSSKSNQIILVLIIIFAAISITLIILYTLYRIKLNKLKNKLQNQDLDNVIEDNKLDPSPILQQQERKHQNKQQINNNNPNKQQNQNQENQKVKDEEEEEEIEDLDANDYEDDSYDEEEKQDNQKQNPSYYSIQSRNQSNIDYNYVYQKQQQKQQQPINYGQF